MSITCPVYLYNCIFDCQRSLSWGSSSGLGGCSDFRFSPALVCNSVHRRGDQRSPGRSIGVLDPSDWITQHYLANRGVSVGARTGESIAHERNCITTDSSGEVVQISVTHVSEARLWGGARHGHGSQRLRQRLVGYRGGGGCPGAEKTTYVRGKTHEAADH